MKSFLIIILLASIICQPSLLISPEERMRRKKEMKAKFIECLKDSASKEFIDFINENESTLRYSIAKNKDKINRNDLLVVKHCKQKLANRNK